VDPATAYRRRWATLGVLAVSLVMIMLDNTILNIALPSLARSLKASESQLQWMVDAYILVFAGLMLTAGSTGDRFGRRTALAAGLAVFGSASTWAAWAGSSGELIAARGLMGLGGALIMPATLSIITNSFPDPKERARALGVWAAVSGIGLVFGPTIGGWLLGHFWWGSVFLVNVPVAATGIVAAVWLVPDTRDPAAPRIDLLGALLSTVGLVTLVWAIIEAPSRGWTSTPVLVGFGVAAVVLAAFVAWEMSVAEPMVRPRAWSWSMR
jgi:MFS family permease